MLNQVGKEFDGIAIRYLCVQSSYMGNIALLSRSVCQALGLPIINFDSIQDIFDFLKTQNKKIFLIIDDSKFRKRNERETNVKKYVCFCVRFIL